MEVNKTYTISNVRATFIVTVLGIENDNCKSLKMQYHEDTPSKPLTYQKGKNYFHFPGTMLYVFDIKEYKKI